jgi:hypothetical protein
VIEREFQDAKGTKAIRSSHGYFCFVVQSLNHTAGNLFSGFEIVEQQLAVRAQRDEILKATNIIGHVNVNGLSPVKVRTTLIGGEKKMLVWNDLEADEKLKIYDKGVQMTNNAEAVYQLLVSYRSGDMWCVGGR